MVCPHACQELTRPAPSIYSKNHPTAGMHLSNKLYTVTSLYSRAHRTRKCLKSKNRLKVCTYRREIAIKKNRSSQSHHDSLTTQAYESKIKAHAVYKTLMAGETEYPSVSLAIAIHNALRASGAMLSRALQFWAVFARNCRTHTPESLHFGIELTVVD